MKPDDESKMWAVGRSVANDPAFVKCPRCWRYHRLIQNYDGLCDRCCQVLLDLNLYVDEIRQSMKAQLDYYHVSNYERINGEWVRKDNGKDSKDRNN